MVKMCVKQWRFMAVMGIGHIGSYAMGRVATLAGFRDGDTER